MRRLAVVVAVLALGSGCPVVSEPCSASTCAGCCDATGVCQEGSSVDACGFAGGACASCTSIEVCRAGACALTTTIDCTLPSTLDFGVVAVGSSTPLTITFSNPTTSSAVANVGTPTDQAAFRTSGARGAITIAPGDVAVSTFNFEPSSAREYVATVSVSRSESCAPSTVTLKGRAIDQVLSWSPASLDFGFAPPFIAVFGEVVFSNAGTQPVEVSNLAIDPVGSDFQRLGPSSLTVPANGTAMLRLGLTSTALGRRNANLTFNTNVPNQPSGLIPLLGSGGGPRLEATPTTLDFGTVASSPRVTETRRLRVRNAGTLPTPAATLRLGPDGGAIFEVRALNATTDAAEFTLLPSGAWDPDAGLSPDAGVTFDVALTATSAGSKEAELTLLSNDPVTPRTTVRLTALAQDFPPCSFTVSAAQLNFGFVASGDVLERSLSFTNTSATACYVATPRLAAGSNAAFSVVSPTQSLLLAPGGSTSITVRVTAPNAATPLNVTGTLSIAASSTTTPRVDVPLLATVGTACLVLPSQTWRFGAVAVGCSSGARTLTVANVCTSPITLTALTTTNPEFSVVSPTAGATLAAGETAALSVRYQPGGVGPDQATLRLTVTQSGVGVDYLLALDGEGNTTGLNTDTFVRPATERTDVLFVIDDSCSMGDKQVALSRVAPGFLAAANTVQNDFQISVITTELNDPSRGTLRRTTGGGFVVPSTPSVSNELASMVQVGTTGATESCLEPAVRALTPPMRNGVNAGFLRADASLALVCVTDARDQAPYGPDVYLSQLRNVRGPQRPEQLSYSVIGPFLPMPSSGCAYDDPNDARHDYLVDQTEGVREEICSADWGSLIDHIARRIFIESNDAYPLTRAPDLAGPPIDVRIGGQSLGTTGWSYDVVRQRITFSPLYVPAPGSTVSVTYPGLCL